MVSPFPFFSETGFRVSGRFFVFTFSLAGCRHWQMSTHTAIPQRKFAQQLVKGLCPLTIQAENYTIPKWNDGEQFIIFLTKKQ
jgi:hypothetical protein